MLLMLLLRSLLSISDSFFFPIASFCGLIGLSSLGLSVMSHCHAKMGMIYAWRI